MDPKRYYVEFAAAYVRGCYPELASSVDDGGVPSAKLDQLFAEAKLRKLRLHRYKRFEQLPRVRRVIGVLKGYQPESVLDIGSGRGAFLWPLLDQMPTVKVTAIDVLAHRVEEINAVARGGISRLSAIQVDAEELAFPDNSFDAITALEVLEHVEVPQTVASLLVKFARKVIVVSVPSKEDDNPEHIRLFTRDSLSSLFINAGARGVRIEYLLNHIIAIVSP